MVRIMLVTGIALLMVAVSTTGGRAAQDEAQARKLINSQGCKACHALEGDGGKLAPSFEQMREKLARVEIRLQLVNQARSHGQGRIPDFSHLEESQINALVDFIRPVP